MIKMQKDGYISWAKETDRGNFFLYSLLYYMYCSLLWYYRMDLRLYFTFGHLTLQN